MANLNDDPRMLDNVAAVIATALSNSDQIESVTSNDDQRQWSWTRKFVVNGQLPDSDIRFTVRLEVS